MLFEAIDLLDDRQPHGAALNMALDEALLLRAAEAGDGRPLLRVYRWECPAVSLGYFEPYAAARAAFPGREAVRRWTGGGVVPHGEDWTYSLIVPAPHPYARERAADSYRTLHALLARALSAIGGGAGEGLALTPGAAEKRSHACFENPVRHDLLHGGRKIAGAAQRRSRFGLLHQGSVQGIALPQRLGERFAATLAASVEPRGMAAAEWSMARELEAAKYATAAWNRRF